MLCLLECVTNHKSIWVRIIAYNPTPTCHRLPFIAPSDLMLYSCHRLTILHRRVLLSIFSWSQSYFLPAVFNVPLYSDFNINQLLLRFWYPVCIARVSLSLWRSVVDSCVDSSQCIVMHQLRFLSIKSSFCSITSLVILTSTYLLVAILHC
jgi:hypothetical protein